MTRWRLAEAGDMPAVQAIFDRQKRRLGFEHWELLDLTKPPVLVAVVHETDGVVDNAVVVEAQAECSWIGEGRPLARDEFAYIAEQIAVNLRLRGLKVARVNVPPQLVVETEGKRDLPITRLLKWLGFMRERKLVGFYKSL